MATPWRAVPGLWRGDWVVCLATGPSLRREDVQACRGRARVIAVNDSFRLAPWADLLWASDARWWRLHFDEAARRFRGILATQDPQVAQPRVRLLRNSGRFGFETDPGALRSGYDGGHAAIHLAAGMGARRIALLGYDLGVPSGAPTHFFGDHPGELQEAPCWCLFRLAYHQLAAELRQLGVRVVNCTRGSALRAFETGELGEVLYG